MAEKGFFAGWRAFLAKHQGKAEESMAYRLAVTLLVMYAIILTLHQLEWPSYWWAIVVLTPSASLLSYYRRYSTNMWLKVFLSFAMVALLLWFFTRLRASAHDPRLPLAELLLWLQTLHAFDLPAKKDLRYTGVVALILMAIACVLTYSSYFIVFLLGFFLLFCYVGVLDFWSDNRTPETRIALGTNGAARLDKGWLSKTVASTVPLAILGAVAIFVFMPRYQGLALRTFPMSWDMQFKLAQVSDGAIVNKNLPQAVNTGGQPRRVDGDSYFGFDSEVNLNTRGRLSDRLVLKVRTSNWQYHRGVTFAEYTGGGWRSGLTEPKLRKVKAPPHYFQYTEGLKQRLTIYYSEVDLPNVVFTPPNPRRLYFPSNELFAVDSFRKARKPSSDINPPAVLISPFNLEEGVVYSVLNQVPNVAMSELKNLGPVPTEGPLAYQLEPYLQLPPGVPDRVRLKALELTDGKTSPWSKAAALTSFLQQNYLYNLEVDFYPEEADTVDHFLFEAKEGYCEQFASTLCVMARQVGLPSRYVTGYLPGKYNPLSGFYEVRALDAHAWSEIYIPGYGWMIFDPVPGENATPDLSEHAQHKWMLEALMEYLKVPKAIRDNVPGLLRLFLTLAMLALALALITGRRKKSGTPNSTLWSYLKRAEELTQSRGQGETIRTWLARIEAPQLTPLADLYEQTFYQGMEPETEQLKALDQLLRDFKSQKADY